MPNNRQFMSRHIFSITSFCAVIIYFSVRPLPHADPPQDQSPRKPVSQAGVLSHFLMKPSVVNFVFISCRMQTCSSLSSSSFTAISPIKS